MKFYWFLNSNSQNLLLARFLIRPILDPKFPLMIHFRKALHLHLTMRGTNPVYMSEGLCTYIQSCGNTLYSHITMDATLISDHVVIHPIVTSKWILHLYLIMWEHIPQSPQNGSVLTFDHGRKQSSHHVRMAHGLITSLWREPRSREHQASP